MKLTKQKNGDVRFTFDSKEQEEEFINGFLEYHLLMQTDIISSVRAEQVTFEIETESGLKPWEDYQ